MMLLVGNIIFDQEAQRNRLIIAHDTFRYSNQSPF
jgi:hypothetical protein